MLQAACILTPGCHGVSPKYTRMRGWGSRKWNCEPASGS